MEVKLEYLIERIKKDAVSEAEKQSQEILKHAQEEAENIIKAAKEEAEKILKSAAKDANDFSKNAEISIKQAGRDLILVLKDKIRILFERILRAKISAELKPDLLKELLFRIIDKWSLDEKKTFQVLVSKEEKDGLLKAVVEDFKNHLRDSINIDISPAIDKGFRVGVKGEDIYYDLSDESLTEMLSSFLSPKITELLKEV